MKKKSVDTSPFDVYLESLNDENLEQIIHFFSEVKSHLLVSNDIQNKIIEDFQNAVLYFSSIGLSIPESIKRLNAYKLGGFYTRPARLWYPLDNSAKIYPISMNHGQMAVFRLSAYLKDEVIPEILQMALTFTIKRFPSFATTVKKGFFWHYLDTTKIRFNIEKDNGLPCQPINIASNSSKTFRVLYYDKRISVEFFHILTDGTGGMVFLKTLLHTYLDLLGVKSKIDSSMFSINEVSTPENTSNAFLNVPNSEKSSGFMDSQALQMSGSISRHKPHQVLHFTLDASKLKSVAKSYDSTITTYLLSQMFLAMFYATDEETGEFSIQVPVNMRKFFPTSTVRNFAMYCGVRLPIRDVTTIEKMVPNITKQLADKANLESMREMMTSSAKMVKSLRFIPMFIKQPIARIVYGFLGDKIFSNTLSNLGVINMPESLLPHIEKFDFSLGPTITNRVACAAVTFNNKTVFSITKITNDPSFEERLLHNLKSDGLDVEVEGNYEH